MHKKLLLISLLLHLTLSIAFAQENIPKFSRPEPLTQPENYFLQPVWAPGGQKIAMAGKNYHGIWLMDRDGKNLTRLSDDIAAGYKFAWSSDSQEIVARTARYENRRRIHIIKVFNVESGESRVLGEYKSAIYGLPKWTSDNQKVYFMTKNGLQFIDSDRAAAIENLSKTNRQTNFYNTRDQFVFLDSNGNEIRKFAPISGSFLNAALSPDGQKIAFEVLGGNMFVVNVDGSEVVDLGIGERPSWSPDNEWLAYMMTTDDGHQILTSDIFVVRTNGTGKTNLTNTSHRLEMNPSWSPDGQTIVYDEKLSGRIFKSTKLSAR